MKANYVAEQAFEHNAVRHRLDLYIEVADMGDNMDHAQKQVRFLKKLYVELNRQSKLDLYAAARRLLGDEDSATEKRAARPSTTPRD